MQTHEFYGKYANVPVEDRAKPLSFSQTGLMTLSDVYFRVKELDDQMRPLVIERDNLVAQSEKYILEHQAGGNRG